MPFHSRYTYNWEIRCTPHGGVGSTIRFKSGDVGRIRPVSWTLEQREDVAATKLEMRFPDAVQFFNAWLEYNPLAPGTIVRVYVNDDLIFTGVIHGHSFRFSAVDRSVTITVNDRMGLLKDACVGLKMERKTLRSCNYTTPPSAFALTRNATDGNLFEAITTDVTPLYLRPWHPKFLVEVWHDDGTDKTRIPFSEYEVMYDIGAIYFRYDPIKFMGQDPTDALHALVDIEDEIYADFVYYDETDDSTMISNILRGAFEHPEASGGLGWTEGVEYTITDETTADILSGMKWDTDMGDGDAMSFMQHLYDDPRIGLAPSYWVRDFEGAGQVTAKLVAQDNDAAIDVDLIMDASFESPLQNIYTRAVLVNNEGTRKNVAREAGWANLFPANVDIKGVSTPMYETPGIEGEVHKGIGYLLDDTVETSWGYFHHGSVGDWGPDDTDVQEDIPLFRLIFDEVIPIDLIHLNCAYTFRIHDDEDIPQLGLGHYDEVQAGKQDYLQAVNGLYKIHENQRLTVEYSTDTGSPPGDDTWHPIHPALYQAEVDPLDARGSWLTVDGIDIETRHIRVVINQPLFFRRSEHFGGSGERSMLWWMTEFQVYSRGRVHGDNEDQPTVQFTDDAGAGDRCMCNLAGEQVDMYRPELLAIAEAMGLKYRTLVLENDDVWEFINKDDELMATPDDCDLVSLGYKYLVTRLDAASKENEWKVQIDPRPDIRIGDTVYSSKINPDTKYLVHGSVLQMISEKLNHSLTLSDHETNSGGEGEGYCS